jgi:SAM-dependent methyltransferase
MKRKHFQKYFSRAYHLQEGTFTGDDRDTIVSGRLVPFDNSKVSVEIEDSIPRFVHSENYTANFGLQWNMFRSTQLDSRTGLRLSADRIWKNTKWSPDELSGKTLLEVGGGAGRFTEIFLAAGAHVVSVDFSKAVDANLANNAANGDALFIQADLYDMPLDDAQFDFVFCYGVLQHTPDPKTAYRKIFSRLKPGGRISIDYYRKFRLPNVWATPKYFWRPLVNSWPPEKILRLIRWYMPLWFPIDNFIRHIPKLGPAMLAVIPIPCWNYVGSGLTYAQRKEWAILDTFDALGAKYDRPLTMKQVKKLVDSPENESTSVFYGSNGVVANVRKTKG